jgi:rRNA maturation endonuclease Nob1
MSESRWIKPDGYGTYEVTCRSCKEEFTVTVYPEFCVLCGEKLEREARPPAKERAQSNSRTI